MTTGPSLQKFVRQSGAGFSRGFDFVLRLILESVILLDGDTVLSGYNANFPQPLGINVQAARALPESSGIYVLSFFAQEPIDENSHGVRVGGLFHDDEMTATATDVSPFFGCGQR